MKDKLAAERKYTVFTTRQFGYTKSSVAKPIRNQKPIVVNGAPVGAVCRIKIQRESKKIFFASLIEIRPQLVIPTGIELSETNIEDILKKYKHPIIEEVEIGRISHDGINYYSTAYIGEKYLHKIKINQHNYKNKPDELSFKKGDKTNVIIARHNSKDWAIPAIALQYFIPGDPLWSNKLNYYPKGF